MFQPPYGRACVPEQEWGTVGPFRLWFVSACTSVPSPCALSTKQGPGVSYQARPLHAEPARTWAPRAASSQMCVPTRDWGCTDGQYRGITRRRLSFSAPRKAGKVGAISKQPGTITGGVCKAPAGWQAAFWHRTGPSCGSRGGFGIAAPTRSAGNLLAQLLRPTRAPACMHQ